MVSTKHDTSAEEEGQVETSEDHLEEIKDSLMEGM